MYTIKHINQLIDIRPFFFSGSSLPNHECSSLLLDGKNFIKKFGDPVLQRNII